MSLLLPAFGEQMGPRIRQLNYVRAPSCGSEISAFRVAADADGLVPVTPKLTVANVIEAHAHRVFPWHQYNGRTFWFRPPKRGVFDLTSLLPDNPNGLFHAFERRLAALSDRFDPDLLDLILRQPKPLPELLRSESDVREIFAAYQKWAKNNPSKGVVAVDLRIEADPAADALRARIHSTRFGEARTTVLDRAFADSAEWNDLRTAAWLRADRTILEKLMAQEQAGRVRISNGEDFDAVIDACAAQSRRLNGRSAQNWISPAFVRVYKELNRMGLAWARGAYRDGQLVAGAYGLDIDGTLTGESMFHDESAGKNLLKLVLQRLAEEAVPLGYDHIDTQVLAGLVKKWGGFEETDAQFRLRQREARDPSRKLQRTSNAVTSEVGQTL